MGYTGDPQKPTDQVRIILGDTNNSRLFLQDEEIQYALDATSVSGIPYPIRAAYRCCTWLVGRFTTKVNITVGPTTINYSGIITNFRSLMQDLKDQGGDIGTKLIPGLPLADNINDPFETDQGSWADNRWY